jgi:hypothetical protein
MTVVKNESASRLQTTHVAIVMATKVNLPNSELRLELRPYPGGLLRSFVLESNSSRESTAP